MTLAADYPWVMLFVLAIVLGSSASPVSSAEIAAQESLFRSSAWTNLYVGAATDYNQASAAWYWELFRHHYDLTTAENGCKMKQVMWNGWCGLPNAVFWCGPKFDKCDSIHRHVDRGFGKAWRGHALIWGAPDSSLSWHNDLDSNATLMRDFIDDYVTTVVQEYSGGSDAPYCWDVVNEAVSDTASGIDTFASSLKDSDYTRALGADYIPISLNAARSVCG